MQNDGGRSLNQNQIFNSFDLITGKDCTHEPPILLGENGSGSLIYLVT